MSAAPTATTAYKILTAPQMETLRRDLAFTGAPIDLTDGYIHLSDAGQVAETLRKHFAGQEDLYLAAVDLTALGDKIRWEVSRGGALFPHLYGALTMDVVIAYAPVSHDGADALVLPA